MCSAAASSERAGGCELDEPTPTVGQTSDDLRSLMTLAADDAAQPAVRHDLEHVIGLLRGVVTGDRWPSTISS